MQSQHVGMLLGKNGVTINAIQRDTGAFLDMRKKPEEGCSTQPVIIRGNAASVQKALERLEGLLQYNAECRETVRVEDAALMSALIGKGGEEINRVRGASGAAIDVAKEGDKSVFKLRGSREAPNLGAVNEKGRGCE